MNSVASFSAFSASFIRITLILSFGLRFLDFIDKFQRIHFITASSEFRWTALILFSSTVGQSSSSCVLVKSNGESSMLIELACLLKLNKFKIQLGSLFPFGI